MGPIMEVIRYENLNESLKSIFDRDLVNGTNCFHLKDLIELQNLANQQKIIKLLELKN